MPLTDNRHHLPALYLNVASCIDMRPLQFSLAAAILLLAGMWIVAPGLAQKQVGNPLFLHMHDKMVETGKWETVIEGSPFFNANWRPAAILLANGTLVNNVPVKMNLLENEIHYLDTAGREMVTTQAVKSVIFLDENNDTSAVFVNKLALPNAVPAPEGWMQLLAAGKASLLKRYLKQAIETKGFSSATPERRINTTIQYLLLYKGRVEKVKSLDDIANLLESGALSTWVAQQRGNKKSEQQLKAAIDYFNSL
jgi:hypothetical protein